MCAATATEPASSAAIGGCRRRVNSSDNRRTQQQQTFSFGNNSTTTTKTNSCRSNNRPPSDESCDAASAVSREAAVVVATIKVASCVSGAQHHTALNGSGVASAATRGETSQQQQQHKHLRAALQQRFSELEDRVKRCRLFQHIHKFASSSTTAAAATLHLRSASADPKSTTTTTAAGPNKSSGSRWKPPPPHTSPSAHVEERAAARSASQDAKKQKKEKRKRWKNDKKQQQLVADDDADEQKAETNGDAFKARSSSVAGHHRRSGCGETRHRQIIVGRTSADAKQNVNGKNQCLFFPPPPPLHSPHDQAVSKDEDEDDETRQQQQFTFYTISRETGCLTSPIPRRKIEMLLSRRPRPRLDPLDAVSTSSSADSFPPEEVDKKEVSRRFEEIKKSSGILNISGRQFFGVKPDDLVWESELGEGTCGTVSKYKYNGRSVAVKRMKRTDREIESKRILMDLEVIRRCNDCPYIVKCYGYIITFEYIYLCMEVMATCLDKQLQKLQRGFPEEIIGKITLDVVKALDYLKENHKIMHRDIKPSNILLDWHGNVKLCDFGISGKLIDSMAQTMSVGCAAYLAPERIQMDSERKEYDVRADVWSLGITLVQLATGAFPYQYSNYMELMVKISRDNPPVPKPEESGLSQDFCDFINACLQKNMLDRPKFKDLLEKPFLQKAENQKVNLSFWLADSEKYQETYGGQ